MSRSSFDVVVIGGGPAGCAAAIDLAKSGARVALFEAGRYPHDKLCGEFLSPECAALLDDLGMASRVQALNPVHIRDITITSPGGAVWNAAFPAPALGLTRRALDAALADCAAALGVEVCEASAVRAVAGDLGSGFKLTVQQARHASEFQARAVVAAHGKRGSLDRTLNRRFLHRRQPFMALKAHFRGPALPHRITLHGFPGGYCGMSEIEGGLVNVCLLVHEGVMAAARRPGEPPVDSFIAWMASQNPALACWLAEAERVSPAWLSIAQVPFLAKEPVVADILLAGDAAGVIAPLAGDGIGMALQAGRLAAEHAGGFLSDQVAARVLPDRYAAAWRGAFGPRLRLGRLLQVLMLRPRLLTLGLRLLTASPGLGRSVIARTRNLDLLAREG